MVTLFLIEPNLRRVDAQLHWEQKAGGVMLLAIAVLAFFLGVYPQPLLNLVQQTGLVG
ncbi:NADH-quinone oxidoreductase subunit N [compost metagenome]